MRIPKYRKNGDGRAFAEYPKSGGKREYFGQYGTPEAQLAYQDWLASLLRGETAPKLDPTLSLGDLAASYLSHIEQRKSIPDYQTHYRFVMLLVERYGAFLPSRINSQILSDLLSKLATSTYERGGKQKRYTRGYLNRCVSVWKRWFRWAAQRKHVPYDLYNDVCLLDPLTHGEGANSRDVKPATIDQLLSIRKYLSPIVYGMVQVQYLCGMRPNEVCRLNPTEIDKSEQIWLYKPLKHKTSSRGRELVKAIPLPAQKIINQFTHPTDENAYIFRPVESLRYYYSRVPEQMKARIREHYRPASYSQAILAACKRAGIEPFTANQIRHSIATDLRKSVGIEAAQHYLGHSSVDMTEIYAERSVQQIVKIANEMRNPFDENEHER